MQDAFYRKDIGISVVTIGLGPEKLSFSSLTFVNAYLRAQTLLY